MAKGRDAKPHIGIFGRRNNGKSSLINALAQQDIAIVSEVPGTTTDPVRKSMEIFGIGPAILVDTAGMDDDGELGKKRVSRSMAVIKTVDLAILVIAHNAFGEEEEDMIAAFRKQEVPFVVFHNKSDLEPLKGETRQRIVRTHGAPVISFSAMHPDNLDEAIDVLKSTMPETAYQNKSLLGGLIKPGELVLLVTPIDSEAPDGRLILPQVQALRDILDNDCMAVVTKEHQLKELMAQIQPLPALVVTDSQVFSKVDQLIPSNIPLTGFSIMLARHKGHFEAYLEGTPHLAHLQDGDKVLLLESCTHQVACDDIGRIKIPNWLNKHTGKKLSYEVVAGLSDIPGVIKDYAMVIQCGGCMITQRQIRGRLQEAIDAGVPVTNYGMAIAWLHGIYDRAVSPFLNLEKS